MGNIVENPSFDFSTSDQATLDRILAIDVRRQPGFEELKGWLQVIGAVDAMKLMKYLIAQGLINSKHFERVADFGAGIGGPTFTMAAVAREAGGEVYAIEKVGGFAREIVKSKILPPGNVITDQDGIEHLETSPNTYSLITAFNFGRDATGELFQRLASASSRALRSNGVLLVASENRTLSAARRVAQQSGNPMRYIRPDTTGIVHGALIIPKAKCAAISGRP